MDTVATEVRENNGDEEKTGKRILTIEEDPPCNDWTAYRILENVTYSEIA